jgi:hypothetical protein
MKRIRIDGSQNPRRHLAELLGAEDDLRSCLLYWSTPLVVELVNAEEAGEFADMLEEVQQKNEYVYFIRGPQ